MEEFKDVQQIVVMTEAEFDRRLERVYQRVIAQLKQPPEHVNETTALQMLGLRSKTSLWKLRSSGAISYSKMGKIILYRRSSLIEFIEKNELKKF